jgi:uncharacterized protein YbbC (DUF1343 family)
MVILLTPNHGVFCSADDSTHFQNYREWDVSKIELRGLMEKPAKKLLQPTLCFKSEVQ